MTNDAMNGKSRVEEVFGRRLEIIRPDRDTTAAVGREYLRQIEPTARATIAALVGRGWTPLIISGGFRNAIAPLAAELGIARVEAVELFFDESGGYLGYDGAFPTTRSGGKPEVIARLKKELRPARIVMVGDGVSDLEAKLEVDSFIGFGRYIIREKVRAGADIFIYSLDELLSYL